MSGTASVIQHVQVLQTALGTLQDNIGRSADPNASTKTVSISTHSYGDKLASLKVSTPRIFADQALEKQIRIENSNVGKSQTIEDLMLRFNRILGQPGASNSLTSQVTRLQGAFARLAARPENLAAKLEVVTMGRELAETFRMIEGALQSARQFAENEIDSSVTSLRNQLSIVADTNIKIAAAKRQGGSAPEDQDSRRVALYEISSLLAATIYEDTQGQAHVTAGIGSQNINLLRSPSTPLVFALTPTLNAATKYPGGLSGLSIGGVDVTGQLPEGKFKALFELRDKILPGLSEQFSQMAERLKDEMNAVHNSASSYPGADQLVGSKTVAGTDTFFGQGQFRIAALDGSGVIQNAGVVNLAGITTVNGLVTAINTALTAAGGTASIDANGHLKIMPANGKYIALNEDTSQVLLSEIKVELFNAAGTSVGVYTYNTSALGSNAAIVTQMNADFGANAKAELVGNKIHISAMGTTQLSLNDFPKTFGNTVQSKGVSHYFGLNDFFHGEANAVSPHISSKIMVNPALEKNANLISHGLLSMTAAVGEVGTTQNGIPDASGVLPVHKYAALFQTEMQFHTTDSFPGRKMSFAEYVNASLGYIGTEIGNASEKRELAESQRDNFTQAYEKSSRKSLREMMLMLSELITAMRSVHMVYAQTRKLEENLIAVAA